MLGATCTKTWDRHPNTIELASWLVHVLCDFKAAWHQETSVPLEYTMKIHPADIFYFLVKALSPSFHYHFLLYIFIKSKLMASTVPVLKLPEKKLLFPLLGMYLSLYPICFELYCPFLANWISVSNFAYIATAKSRVSEENISIKWSSLPPNWPIFTAIVLPIIYQIYQINSYSSHSLRGRITT